MKRNDGTFVLEDAKLRYRPNFAGEERPYNNEGERNFTVDIPPRFADDMKADGYNVRWSKPTEDEPDGVPNLKINVGYKIRPPKIYMITSRGRTLLGEDNVAALDWADIVQVDLIARPYDYFKKTGRQGLAAYVQTMFVVIREDELELKWAHVPDAALPVREDVDADDYEEEPF